MLHAITHGKTRLYRRYLGHRDGIEKRVSEEDEITALIMGPLAFLPASAIGAFWTALARWNSPEIEFPGGAVTHAEMRFWPRANRIEPDLRVELFWGQEKRLLLVEFKWQAPLSGENQLHKQWQDYLSHEEREHALHLFIAPDTSEGSNALSRNDVWKGRLLLRSWFDVLNVLRHLAGPEVPSLRCWSSEVIRCLEKLGIRPFRGFKHLSAPEVVPQKAEVFWRGFDGFAHLVAPELPPLNVSQQAFFSMAGGHCG
ncbi:hypothetical protein ACFSKY_03725 [Azotobacter chroococcum]|uniref:PD-(D/E)XK nuclease superfamily protein n=1 Tax=Azotobacter chroococcum TaxID=353 RepID=A0A4R1Q1J0_9GAMM|nr:hypothetical protein [Azotobacter chroococcum]TBV98584.1 hypothetical protein E0E53_06080 [Azotobacter chroococcum]TBW03544.1 hypothetical protein E0E52_14680 [Azotobacter chroococcum]TCL34790.1 hypothetical protein EV691_101225 [Azotobacter chroococcum]